MAALNNLRKTFTRIGVTLYKHRATIAYWGGTALTAVGTGLIAKGAGECAPILENYKEQKKLLTNKKEIAKLKKDTVLALTKKMAPGGSCYILGQMSVGYAVIEQKKDISALGSEVGYLTGFISLLKERITADGGEEKWRQYALGEKTVDIIKEDENGNTIEEKVTTYEHDGLPLNVLVFDENNVNWHDSFEANDTFISGILFYAKSMLDIGKKVTFHEVLRRLIGEDAFEALPKQYLEATAKAGWVPNKGNEPMVTIDFGYIPPDVMPKEGIPILLTFNYMPNMYI